VDAAVIAVPTTAHAEVSLAALDAGVHLLIEKPIAASVEEADAIVQRAEANGLVVRFEPADAENLPYGVDDFNYRFVDLDGPLLLARDRENGLRYDDSLVYPPESSLWG